MLSGAVFWELGQFRRKIENGLTVRFWGPCRYKRIMKCTSNKVAAGAFMPSLIPIKKMSPSKRRNSWTAKAIPVPSRLSERFMIPAKVLTAIMSYTKALGPRRQMAKPTAPGPRTTNPAGRRATTMMMMMTADLAAISTMTTTMISN